MRTYRIKYTRNGDIRYERVKAQDERQARVLFYCSVSCDDIISVEDITENV